MTGKNLSRRRFLANAAAASVGLSLTGLSGSLYGRPEEKPVRLGFVGVGNRGTGLLRHIMAFKGVEIPALCDINEAHLARAQKIVEETLGKRPEGYCSGPEGYRKLCERDDLDAVATATPWELHTPVMLAAMENGKYGATEVPAAITLEQCWQLVETSEKTGMPCMMLENVCYYRQVMTILNMIQQGIFGELLHCEAGYQHDVRYLRGVEGKIGHGGELLWRGRHAITRNGNLYPTHPIGPVAWWLGINRGDRFSYLVSMSTKSRGMNHLIAKMFGEDHPNARIKYALGDINTTLIRTENGVTVTLYHDTQSPRPYDLIFRVQGTEGIFSGTLDKFYFEDRSPEPHTWEDSGHYHQQYEHPLWKKLGKTAQNYGHSGGDYLEWHQFLHAVRNKLQTPIDVYDSATWSVISPLSEMSVAEKSKAVDFPDFTRGKWRVTRPVEIFGV
ncbi:MAG: Gfo/Idh/MocA family oxidoreductase [Candidatus Glassbacteria bacterium]|nr:Gfo/Idh/MocA family oxidoreductase [Candidatus Glassbacteria bacterium]